MRLTPFPGPRAPSRCGHPRLSPKPLKLRRLENPRKLALVRAGGPAAASSSVIPPVVAAAPGIPANPEMSANGSLAVRPPPSAGTSAEPRERERGRDGGGEGTAVSHAAGETPSERGTKAGIGPALSLAHIPPAAGGA